MHDNKSISLSILNQIPEFIQESNPLFQKFMEGYYRSQEKIGGPLNIINNLTDYMNIDSYDLKKLDGNTQVTKDVNLDDTTIQVENVDGFLDEDGTILINDEIIYYKEVKKSPSITFSPAISLLEFGRKKIILSNPFKEFDGIKKNFKLISNNEPIFPTTSKHLIVKLYNKVLIPNLDYQVLNDEIIFTEAPREFDSLGAGDDAVDVSLEYLKGFETQNIIEVDLVKIDNNKFKLKANSFPLIPTSDVLLLVILDNKLLRAYDDYSTFEDVLIISEDTNSTPYVSFINFTTTAIGSGCLAYSLVNDFGEVESITIKDNGKNYSQNNIPKVSISRGGGQYATARSLVDGIKSITLLEGGFGYSKQNPPVIKFQDPQNVNGVTPKAYATVNDQGSIEQITLTNSGSGYDSIPRIQFINPFGAEVDNVSVNPDTGQVVAVEVISPGVGYTIAPQIYIDQPSEENGIPALLQGHINDDGELISIEVINSGQGYSATNLPRVKVIQPTGAQVLDVSVDSFGRVISIELLSGGSGYTNIPSVYIVDDRKDNIGNPIGGTGAQAVATVFNNQISDISIIEFGSGYSAEEPPTIYISVPDSARASATIGKGEITGIEVINSGLNYSKTEFIGCSRGVSGIADYTEDNKAIFVSEDESKPSFHETGSFIKSLDSVFFAKLIDRLVEQYLPGLPKIPLDKVNISNILKTAKDFYASKGTQFSLKYLFNVLYGVPIEISYPKDQIIKPSAASWSIDTIMRAKLISGNPINLTNALIEQLEDPIDTNVMYATGLIENYIAIQTPDYDVYELTLSEESLQGNFVIPYKTKLTERINPDDIIITVDSTIGWPERNGEIIIGNEVIRYREKSLTQFIECTRGIFGIPQEWDSGTDCSSNFFIYVNRGTPQEVILSILGIIEASNTTLLDDGKYYLPGDKLNISKLGSTEDIRLLDSWLYNVKKLLTIEEITFGGQNNRTATVVCENPHGLLVGDQFTIYGANPIVYNGTFLVTSIPFRTTFTYELPQPVNLNPQGTILASIDLNKGKSDSTSINNTIGKFASNVQNAFFNEFYVYVASSGIPNYKIGPFIGTALLPGNQRKLNRFSKLPVTVSLKEETRPGSIGTFVNGISVWNYKSPEKFSYGPLTKINILDGGKNYDAIVPPKLIISGSGQEATGRVVVNGSVVEIEVTSGGSGYTSSPLVSISGGGGDGGSGTAIVTNGVVTRILVNTSGSGFTTRPTVNIVGGGGSGATANAIVRGPISEVIVENAGKDFTTPPTISLNSGSGAAADAFVINGRINSIAVISSGFGYTTAPNVIITGDGFGAVAKATISTEGAEAGRVIGITILNRGVGYRPGTTIIRLESIGEGAKFQSEIFQWTFNLDTTLSFDSANGTIFEGYNKQFGGEYGHISNPKQLRFVLGDNLTISDGSITEKQSGLEHSPIIGWAFDGNPIYGPYGFIDPTNVNSGVTQIRSGYVLKSILIFNEITNPNPIRVNGPLLEEFPAGIFIEDYEYLFRSEAVFLDEYNGRFTKTPEYPDGVYAYFITLNTDGTSAFPYVIGDRYYSQPDSWNLNQFAIQSNIPKGIVRYRDPFENVDIDSDRQTNDVTNLITLEDGNFLTFEFEDLNRDGFISEDENIDIFILEESKLEIFDYFPKIKISSKVDIEVETTTRFEDAKITEFLIENPGINHQVGDRLIFDNTDTEGDGASASVSKILGEGIVNYNYRYNESLDVFEGIVTTDTQHNLEVGDSIEVTTMPQMEPVSKVIKMLTIPGLEKVSVNRSGIGYSDDIDISINIESETGINAEVIPVISSTGVFEDVNILNSGNSFTDTPRIRVSHPQIRSRSNYFALGLTSGEEIKISNSIVLDNKEFYIIGSIISQNGDTHGFISKFNSEGFLLWRKTLSSVQPTQEIKSCKFTSLVKDGNSIYVVGETRPNAILSNAFNPDIILIKLTETSSGATINWQRQYGGISGASREDYATDIAIYNGNILVTGYTTTNSNHTNDAIIMHIASNGDTLTRRKITSPSSEDKFYQIKVNSKNEIYLLGTSLDGLYLSKVDIIGNRIVVSSTKTINSNDSSFRDLSLIIDEYDDIYITGSQKTISTNITNKLFVIRMDSSQNIKWSNSYLIPESISLDVSKASIDLFGEINVACSVTSDEDFKYIISTKIDYLGNSVKTNKIQSNEYDFEASSCISDVSGDPILFGNYYDNTNSNSYALKLDKNSDSIRLGELQFQNWNLSVERSLYNMNKSDFECQVSNYILASEGFQILDFTDVLSFLQQDTQNITSTLDIWSSRTATIPSPGGRTPLISSKSYNKFFFRVFNTSRVDNIRSLAINQSFSFNIGSTLTQFNSIGIPIASAKIVDFDVNDNLLYVSLVNGSFSLNSGSLASSDELINEINNYVFANQDSVSPGTFTIEIPSEIDAIFKEYSDEDYQVRIDEVIPGSPYSRGSVVVLGSSFFSFNTDRSEVTITGLTAVTQISLLTNLKKVFKITEILNTNQLFVNSSTSHYLNDNDIIYLQTSPEYAQTNGTYYVDKVLNKKEFIFTLREIPSEFIGAGASVSIFVKHPIIRLIYGQQYAFDTSDISNQGHFLSFYRDNLNRIEYTFKNIIRQGIPGVDQPGNAPFISFRVTEDVSNISYYNDPSKPIDENPVGENSYIDVLPSPYIGTFTVKELGGGTITSGATQMIFPLKLDPEKPAIASLSSYTTSSRKAVGSIAAIRLINGGGFYKKLPIITGFDSIRKIERVEIINPGTEYQPGQYFGIPISGDGAGGRVRITVDGNTDPVGQIVEIVITDPGKGYTNAFIDVDAIPGILGPQLSGSGAVLRVIIPPRGTGASIFVKGNNVGKIKRLKNNNFGFDYTHDYTLRPEITFPVNLQLTSTSVLSSIKVVDPGTGYSSPPEVSIVGGGGTGAEAEAILRNGRISFIIIKNPGSGYTTPPNIELKSSFNYVVNLDLQLFQFAIPHGIPNGAEVKFDIRDLGEGADYPLTSFGFINPNQIYYAISGSGAGLEDDQLRIGLTPADASTGNFISFANGGNGRQIVLTDSFGGKAEAIIETARFLSGEKVFQGFSIENATAVGFVSENDGWQIGPRILKLVNYTGDFKENEVVTGSISKASGVISDISIAKGILEVDSTTTTPGKFLDDVGKTNEIIQRVQDSYLYQSFSYNVKSPISIDEWKNIVIDNVHPAGFKVFGEIGITGEDKGAANKTDFEITKSVNLIESSIISHIDNFALVEPIYSEFDNTQVLFRNKRLTSSEEILTSIVQKLDDISNLFDGARTVFPLTIDGSPVVAQSNQFMININGTVQSPGSSFNVQQGNIVFSEPPPAPTRISYAIVELQYEETTLLTLTNISGIIPEIGNTIRGLVSNATATVASSTSTTLTVFNIQGSFLPNEVVISPATGLNANIISVEIIESTNVYRFRESITNLRKNTAVIEEINLDVKNNILTNTIVISKTSGTYDSPSGLLDIRIDDFIVSAQSGIVAKVVNLSPYTDPNTYIVINSDYAFVGDFEIGEIVIGSTSSSVGEVVFWNPEIKRLILKTITGVFVPNEIIIGQTSSANHRILTTIKINPVSSIAISDPSRFTGLLFNRIVNPLNPNTTVDDISKSLVEVVDIDNSSIKVESSFAEFEVIETNLIDYTNTTGELEQSEFIQNIEIRYANETDSFQESEDIEIRKLTYYDLSNGNFIIGDTLTGATSGSTANIIGINYALKTIYIGDKVGNFISGEVISNGSNTAKVSTYFTIPFVAKQIISNEKTIITDQIYTDAQHRFRDAANLLRLNSSYIIDEAAGRLKNRYPSLVIPGDGFNSVDGTNRCKLDLSLLLQAVISDLENGGNYESVTAARFYIDSNGGLRFIERQVLQSVYAHTQMNELCQKAVIGQLSETPQYTNRFPVPPIGITEDPGDCADVRSQIDTLWNSINDVIAPTGNVYRDAGDLIWFNRNFIADESIAHIDSEFTFTLGGIEFKAFQYPGGSSATCKRDLVEFILPSIISDLVSGGDVNTINAIKFYVNADNNIEFVKDEILPTVVALEKANQLCQYAINNWIISGSTEYNSLYEITTPKYKDLSIIIDDGTYGGNCADIKSAIDVLFQKAIDILIPASQVNRDTAKLIMFNKQYIQTESLQRTLNNYPNFQVPGGNAKCLRDIGFIVDAIVYDLLTDGNSAIYEASLVYIDPETGTVSSLEGELIQSIYAYQQVRELMKQAAAETLANPATASGFIPYTDDIQITGSDLLSVQTFVDTNMQILLGTLNNPNYIDVNSIEPLNSISIPAISYPVRDPLTPVKGGITSGDYIYGINSEQYGEISAFIFNRAKVKTLLKRLIINFSNPIQRFEVNQELTVLGQPTRVCKVYSVYYSETINFIDVEIISGSINTADILLNENNFTADVIAINDRIQITNVLGSFETGNYFRAPKTNTESFVSSYTSITSSILSNVGGNLTLQTESMEDKFHVSNIVYSTNSDVYLDVIAYEGTQLTIGSLVKSTNVYRLRINLVNESQDVFVVGGKLENSLQNKEAIIINYDVISSSEIYLYVVNLKNDVLFDQGETVVYFDSNQNITGLASITQITITNSPAYGFVKRIISIGNAFRIYLSDVNGTFAPYSQLISRDYRSGIVNIFEIKGRVSRSFRGFDGIQKTFKLTSNNGVPYFPDADGHVLVFINGILQPVGVSYNTFSDIIEFLEAPELGSSFHATYIGKLRKLDDLSFQFDSLRSSFNLRLNEVFYSLTITDGVQSTNIKPENNIIVSLNGVIQEPGVAFEIVGSRINFAEVPRAGSTFVAYSYIGSDADVIAATVIPPIESGDQLLIEAEDRDRTVAIVESSNSLLTFDYQGSVFGRNALALSNLIEGRIESVQLTSGGDGYTSTPTVSLSSATGFDGQVRAQVGISRVDVINSGSGYKYPKIEVLTEIADFEDTSTFDSSAATFDLSVITFDAS